MQRAPKHPLNPDREALNQVLVVEYQDKRGNNLTAVWAEDSKLPRVFLNTPNSRMFDMVCPLPRESGQCQAPL